MSGRRGRDELQVKIIRDCGLILWIIPVTNHRQVCLSVIFIGLNGVSSSEISSVIFKDEINDDMEIMDCSALIRQIHIVHLAA